MPRDDATRPVGKSDARKFLVKMREFLAGSEDALASGHWNSAGLTAIHAGISAADAVVVAFAGVRSASKDHTAIANLLQSKIDNMPTPQLRQLTGLLSMKNAVEYEQRLLTESESRALVQQAARFCGWAEAAATERLGDR